SADCNVTTLLSGGHNLFGLNTGCSATLYDQTIAGDEVATNVLGALADNGGALLKDETHPLTHALRSGSPAIDAAWGEYCLAVDQTGTERALGNACDLGSVESSEQGGAAFGPSRVINVDTTDDELNSDGDCSLREAIEAANTDSAVDGCSAGDGWDTVQVPAGTYELSITGDDEDNNQTGDLDVLAPLTIRGASAATTVIDAQQNDRVLDVLEVTLRARDIAFKNGLAGSSKPGGCLRNFRGYLTLINSEVSLCESNGRGGGVYNEYGALHIYDSSIHDNSGIDGGGAYNYYGLATIQGGSVFQNSASRDGGGFESYVAASRISGVEFYFNEAGWVGGGVHQDYGVLLVEKNSVIRENESTLSSGPFVGGGGICTSYSATLIRDSVIRDNQSFDSGGGLEADGGVWVVSSTIEGNTAVLEGGGVEGNGIYQQTTFQSNTAESGGGFHGAGILQESVLSENTSSTGGGVYATGALIYGSTISGNQADDADGGGVYVKNGGGVCLFESSVEDNEATSNGAGAGIYVESLDASLVLRSSSVTGQSGVSSGGGLYNLGVADIINSTFSGNSAESAGGVYNGATLSLLHSTVADNSASSGSAGGLLNERSAMIQSTIIAGNAANQSVSDATADCSVAGGITASSFNLVGESTGCAFDAELDQSIAPADVFVDLLKPLEQNELGTRNHQLVAGSLAVDQVPCLLLLDQVGTERPQESLCDNGSIEWFAVP
ncbi:MAG: CSLREA domain-containing protein, partial [Polyangiaceae bacterium]|nr:CSLREA domain-containing protein [Polyangiaceae bacterium]